MGLLHSLSTIGFGLARSYFRKRHFKKSDLSYSILTGHPDDEILISGLLQRLVNTGSQLNFSCLTDGGFNADGSQRLVELANALDTLGYHKDYKNLVLANEKKIYETVIRGTNDELANLVNGLTHQFTQQLLDNQPDVLLLPDFCGTHFIHDLTQYIGVAAAKKYLAETSQAMAVYEFPQCVLLGSENYSTDELNHALKEFLTQGIKMPHPIKIMVGDLSQKAPLPTLNDPPLGINYGELKLTPTELWRKIKARQNYPSQKSSLDRYLTFYQLADISCENFRAINLDQDFTQKPSPGPLFYEVCYWRTGDLGRLPVFDDFKRLVSLTQTEPLNPAFVFDPDIKKLVEK